MLMRYSRLPRALFFLEHQSSLNEEWKLLRDIDGDPAAFVFDTQFEAERYACSHFALQPVRVAEVPAEDSADFLRELAVRGVRDVIRGYWRLPILALLN